MPLVLDEPDFRAAVGFAKGLAKQSGAKELSPLLLLCGFALASRAGKLSDAEVQELLVRDGVINQAASVAGLKLSKMVDPFDERLPTGAALRELLRTAGDSLAALVNALFNSIESVTANSSGSVKSVDAIVKEAGFSETVDIASAIARSKGLEDISPELLVAGAFFALREGFLRKRPAICAHLRANEPSINALIEARGWTFEKPEQQIAALPLAPSVEKAIEHGDDDSDPLIVALNAGIDTASEIMKKKRIAYHEAGHAVISNILRPTLGITQVTIIEKGDADGYVSYDRTSSYYKQNTSREDFLDEICVSLAGRVAEQKKYGHDEIDGGASDDLEKATARAWDAITKLGLDFEFGPVSLVGLFKTGAMAGGWLIDQAQRRLQEVLKDGLARTEKLVAENWIKVEAVAQILFEKKKLTEDDLITIMENADGKKLSSQAVEARASVAPVEQP
jgi:hypothetical protein